MLIAKLWSLITRGKGRTACDKSQSIRVRQTVRAFLEAKRVITPSEEPC